MLKIDPAFDAINVDGQNVESMRNQLTVWVKHIAVKAVKMRECGNQSAMVDDFFLEGLVASSNLANYDVQKLAELCAKADYVLQLVEYLETAENPEFQAETESQINENLANFPVLDDDAIAAMVAEFSEQFTLEDRKALLGEVAFGLHSTVLAGLRGVAYLTREAVRMGTVYDKRRTFEIAGLHTRIKELNPRKKLDKELREKLTRDVEAIERELNAWREQERVAIDGIVDVLAFLATDSTDEDALIDALKKVGEVARVAYKNYEFGINATYGVPEPKGVRTAPTAGPCVVFSGDDFDVLKKLLVRAEFNGINVWTRGDALAAHAYPELRSPQLVGHYGGPRCDQNKDLGAFPGATLVTSGPFDEPTDDYYDYTLTTCKLRWDTVRPVGKMPNGSLDFSGLVQAAQDSGGYPKTRNGERIAVGFGGSQLPDLVEKAARAFRSGDLKRVFVLGGEDVPYADENYFGQLAELFPLGNVALTFGDVKFRFNRKPAPLTDSGLPRFVDMGRVSDMNATLRFAEELNKELDRNPKNSPMTFFISLWSERSATAVLAACSLGYEVFVGPYRPNVWTEQVANVLREKLGVKLVDDPQADLSSIKSI